MTMILLIMLWLRVRFYDAAVDFVLQRPISAFRASVNCLPPHFVQSAQR